MGILLDYARGGRKALGQCRFGVDKVQTCTWPNRLCYIPSEKRTASQPIRVSSAVFHTPTSFSVESGNEADHTHDENEWECTHMTGNLNFWFSKCQSFIRHEKAN